MKKSRSFFIEKSFSSLRFLWRLIPLKSRISMKARFPIILNPTYADDGLISKHITDFLKNEKFMEAYELGKETGALKNHPGDIHFRAYVACWAGKYALGLQGDFVECGVGRGLLSRTVAHYLDFEKRGEKFYLFDTFEGIPVEDAFTVIEQENMISLNKTHFDNDYYQSVKRTFIKYKNICIIKGRVPESFDSVELGPIAYISMDMNNAFAEIAAIEYLWDKLVTGGIIVLDDYAYGPEFLNQKEAWDKFAASKNFEILTLPTGQGLIIKTQ